MQARRSRSGSGTTARLTLATRRRRDPLNVTGACKTATTAAGTTRSTSQLEQRSSTGRQLHVAAAGSTGGSGNVTSRIGRRRRGARGPDLRHRRTSRSAPEPARATTRRFTRPRSGQGARLHVRRENFTLSGDEDELHDAPFVKTKRGTAISTKPGLHGAAPNVGNRQLRQRGPGAADRSSLRRRREFTCENLVRHWKGTCDLHGHAGGTVTALGKRRAHAGQVQDGGGTTSSSEQTSRGAARRSTGTSALAGKLAIEHDARDGLTVTVQNNPISVAGTGHEDVNPTTRTTRRS